MAGPLPGRMDSVSYDNWRSARQLRAQCRARTGQREICESVGANWYTPLSPVPLDPHTNGTLAIGLLVMMYPILCKVKYESLHHVFRQRAIWVQIGFSIIMNWIVAPLLMV
jgi:hypothetical protein